MWARVAAAGLARAQKWRRNGCGSGRRYWRGCGGWRRCRDRAGRHGRDGRRDCSVNRRFNVRCRCRCGCRGRPWCCCRGCCRGRGHSGNDRRVNIGSRSGRGGRQRLGHGGVHGRLNVGGWLRLGRCARGDGGGEERGKGYSDGEIPGNIAHSPILLVERFRI